MTNEQRLIKAIKDLAKNTISVDEIRTSPVRPERLNEIWVCVSQERLAKVVKAMQKFEAEKQVQS